MVLSPLQGGLLLRKYRIFLLGIFLLGRNSFLVLPLRCLHTAVPPQHPKCCCHETHSTFLTMCQPQISSQFFHILPPSPALHWTPCSDFRAELFLTEPSWNNSWRNQARFISIPEHTQIVSELFTFLPKLSSRKVSRGVVQPSQLSTSPQQPPTKVWINTAPHRNSLLQILWGGGTGLNTSFETMSRASPSFCNPLCCFSSSTIALTLLKHVHALCENREKKSNIYSLGLDTFFHQGHPFIPRGNKLWMQRWGWGKIVIE